MKNFKTNTTTLKFEEALPLLIPRIIPSYFTEQRRPHAVKLFFKLQT